MEISDKMLSVVQNCSNMHNDPKKLGMCNSVISVCVFTVHNSGTCWDMCVAYNIKSMLMPLYKTYGDLFKDKVLSQYKVSMYWKSIDTQYAPCNFSIQKRCFVK